MPFPFILQCKLLSNHHPSLPFAFGDVVCVTPGSQFSDINYEPLRSTFLPHAHKGKFCEERWDKLNSQALIEEFHFSQRLYTPALENFFFILKAIKRSVLHSGLHNVENFKKGEKNNLEDASLVGTSNSSSALQSILIQQPNILKTHNLGGSTGEDKQAATLRISKGWSHTKDI